MHGLVRLQGGVGLHGPESDVCSGLVTRGLQLACMLGTGYRLQA